MSILSGLILAVALSAVLYVAIAPSVWARRDPSWPRDRTRGHPHDSGGYSSWAGDGGGGGHYGDGGGGGDGGGDPARSRRRRQVFAGVP